MLLRLWYVPHIVYTNDENVEKFPIYSWIPPIEINSKESCIQSLTMSKMYKNGPDMFIGVMYNISNAERSLEKYILCMRKSLFSLNKKTYIFCSFVITYSSLFVMQVQNHLILLTTLIPIDTLIRLMIDGYFKNSITLLKVTGSKEF